MVMLTLVFQIKPSQINKKGHLSYPELCYEQTLHFYRL